jgi:diguanylate cyclase (GGDEF)-like protein
MISVKLENDELHRENEALRRENERLRTCERLAYRDDLTDLYNRRYFEERARQELSRAHRRNTPVAIVFLDLDHFKLINDRAGHPAGDRVLVELGSILARSCRGADIPCRIGGDEFALIVPDTDRVGTAALMERVEEELAGSKPMLPTDLAKLTISFSYGIAVYPEDGMTSEALAEAADHAMYAHKRAHHGNMTGIRHPTCRTA